ncbi:MAG: CHASE2 domain-containing protein [Spirochaetales bacterium]|nr:CHASE2 domain-containing protein [Spirochaetales bacterium]
MIRNRNFWIKHGKILFGVSFLVIISAFFVPAALFGLFDSWENRLIDLRSACFNRKLPVSKDIVFIAIDKNSLKVLGRTIGQWPWPRGDYIAHRIIDYVMTGQPSIVLFDIAFPEKYTKRPEQEISEQDNILIAATINYGAGFKLSHGMEFHKTKGSYTPDFPLTSEVNFEIKVNDSLSNVAFTKYNDYLLPFYELNSSSTLIHSINHENDTDGFCRSDPLLFKYKRKFYPGIVLRALEARFGLSGYRINGKTLKAGKKDDGVLSIPLTKNGSYRLNFCYDLNEFNVYTAAAIMASSREYDKKDMDSVLVQPDEFKNKIVIIGTTAARLKNTVRTSVMPELPDSYIHLTALSNILMGHNLVELPAYVNIMILILSAASVLLVSFFVKNPVGKNAVIFLYCLVFILVSLLVFRYLGLLVEISITLTAITVTYFCSLLFSYLKRKMG